MPPLPERGASRHRCGDMLDRSRLTPLFGALIATLSITIWSATSGTGVLMQALTIAYEEQETRGLVPFYVRAIALTLGVGLLAILSLFLIAVVPAVIGMLPLPESWREPISMIRWPILAGLVLL